MVNFGLNSASILGIVLALIGLSLVPLRLVLRQPFNPLNLIQDIFLGLVYVLCGLILFWQGWRLDPILQFVQVLLTGSVIYLVIKDMVHRSSSSRG